ncbi:hypothetical protein ACQP2F_11980 [Actinoplanes sp. CA-030573]|uniref:hypothetical protein n=1 Tax=Actinoplanes sp. CA-030573 TaxID=3239898 RepID=UPI003D937D5E
MAGVSQAPRVAASIPADPVMALAAAKAKLGRESARFTQDGGSDIYRFTGVVNAETKSWEVTGRDFVVRRVGRDLYVQASGRALHDMALGSTTIARLAAGDWVHTGLPLYAESSVVFNDAFPWNLANPANRAGDITRTGSRSFTGQFTSKDKRPSSTPRPDITFRVNIDLDEQGRFSKISTASVGKSGAYTTIFTLSDYGLRTDLAIPPADQVVEEKDPFFLSATLLP